MLSRLKKCGGIKVDGNVVTVRHICEKDCLLTLEIHDTPSENITPVDLPLDIIYEDEYILAVNKPSGMPTHPSINHRTDTLANAVMFHYKNAPKTFHPITRLDGDTTGIVLIAKNSFCSQRLSSAMQSGKISKEYLAICCGVPAIKEGTINAKISRVQDSVIKRQISNDGKDALTVYSVKETSKSGKFSLIHLIPKTGRTHQLRLHYHT
jgi:23S rRNA pseudouridine1911/1915/1917 synthase